MRALPVRDDDAVAVAGCDRYDLADEDPDAIAVDLADRNTDAVGEPAVLPKRDSLCDALCDGDPVDFHPP